MESALLEVGTRKQTENDEEQVGCRRVVVGVASYRRCCCGRHELPAVLLWASRATSGAAVALWAS